MCCESTRRTPDDRASGDNIQILLSLQLGCYNYCSAQTIKTFPENHHKASEKLITNWIIRDATEVELHPDKMNRKLRASLNTF
jgi:hypothetical protein